MIGAKNTYREFWTDGHTVVDSAEDAYAMKEGGYNLKHVIEYLALQALIDENESLSYALGKSNETIKDLVEENAKLVEKLNELTKAHNSMRSTVRDMFDEDHHRHSERCMQTKGECICHVEKIRKLAQSLR